MKRIPYLAFFLAATSFLAAMAQYDVRPVSQQDPDGGTGLTYCLPQNAFRIEITVEKTIRERGIYSDYADQLLKLPAIKENCTTYEIKGIRIHTFAYPDPDRTYRIDGYGIPALNLSPEGFLLGVNSGMEPTLPKPAHPVPEPEKNRPGRLPKSDGSFAPVTDLNASKRFDTLVFHRSNDTMTVIEKILKPRIDEKSLFEQARKMADQILKIQNDQADLLSGLQEVAYPEGTLKFMYRQLERNERRFLDCFTGTVRKERLDYASDIFLQQGKDTYPIVFFSPEEGIEHIEGDIEGEHRSDTDILYLKLEILPGSLHGKEGNRPTPTKEGKTPPKGFAYRIPARVKAEIRYNGQTMKQENTFVAQWGEVRRLPLLDGYTIRFHKETGALQYVGKIPQGEVLPMPKKNKH